METVPGESRFLGTSHVETLPIRTSPHVPVATHLATGPAHIATTAPLATTTGHIATGPVYHHAPAHLATGPAHLATGAVHYGG